MWLPAGVGAYEALAPLRRGAMRLALQFAVVAALSMMLGLMRWPSVHWHLALAFERAAPPEQAVFFLLTSIVWLQSEQPSRWIGWLGLVTAVFGFVGMLRNIVPSVAPVAALNNYLLPVFMIVLGVALARWRSTAPRTPLV